MKELTQGVVVDQSVTHGRGPQYREHPRRVPT
jgi:hypothetical protein